MGKMWWSFLDSPCFYRVGCLFSHSLHYTVYQLKYTFYVNIRILLSIKWLCKDSSSGLYLSKPHTGLCECFCVRADK